MGCSARAVEGVLCGQSHRQESGSSGSGGVKHRARTRSAVSLRNAQVILGAHASDGPNSCCCVGDRQPGGAARSESAQDQIQGVILALRVGDCRSNHSENLRSIFKRDERQQRQPFSSGRGGGVPGRSEPSACSSANPATGPSCSEQPVCHPKLPPAEVLSWASAFASGMLRVPPPTATSSRVC